MLCHNDIGFTSVYDSKNVLYMAKKVITGQLPPPVVVLVHADHDVHPLQTFTQFSVHTENRR